MDKTLKPANNQVFYTTIDEQPLKFDDNWFFVEIENEPEKERQERINVDSLEIISNEYNDNLGIITFTKDVIDFEQINFDNQETLKEISLPDSLKSYRDGLFNNCINLEYVNLSNSLTELFSSSFSNCKKLTNIDLPSSIEIIGDSAFYKSGLKNINLKNIKILKPCVFHSCKLSGTFNTYNIEEIGNQCFYNTKINKLILNKKLEKLDDWCFYGMPFLEEIEWNCEKIKTIPENCFNQCYSLENINIPNYINEFFGNSFDNGQKIYINKN